jgi:hypothetical protein
MLKCRLSLSLASLGCVVFLVACGGAAPTAPPPTVPPPPPPPVAPPANATPTIDAIVAQGRRPRQPARYADLRETIDVSATVADPETSLDELSYEWTSTAGTFTGTGRTVTWTAPDNPAGTVTISLKLTENYGHPGQEKIYKHEVTGTVVVRVHDSGREIGDMAWRFLDEFSKPQTNRDWQDIMRDFKAAACPQPGEPESERTDVVNHYTNYVMHDYSLGAPAVNVTFGGSCAFRGKLGDACVSVPVFWDSTDTRNNLRSPTRGIDHLAAVYSREDSRWWLCSSDFEPFGTAGHSLYSR